MAGPLVAVPQIDALAISLVVLLAILGAIALIALAEAIVKALVAIIQAVVGHIPIVGRFVTTELTKLEHEISTHLGAAEAGLDKAAGTWLHEIGGLFSWFADEIRRHANLLWLLSSLLVGPAIVALIRHTLHWVQKELSSTKAQVKQAQTAVAHEQATGASRAHAGAVTAIAPVKAQVTHVTTVDLPSIRGQLHELEDAYTAVKARLKALPKRLTAATVGALALAIVAKVGGGWIKCSNWNKLGRAGCRLPFHFLDDLLALITDYFVLTNICSVVGWLEDGFGVVEGPIATFVGDITAGVCRNRNPGKLELAVPTLHYPDPVSTTTLSTP